MRPIRVEYYIYITDTTFNKRKNIKNIQNKHRNPNNNE